MEYIQDSDYQYIMNKYHDQAKPFDSLRRFVRHDEIFADDTGMEAAAILSGIKEQDKILGIQPHPIRKAKAFEYVLKNTRISCDKRDRFPAINMIDRPINVCLINNWKKEVLFETVPEINDSLVEFNRTGLAKIMPDFDHSVPFWERILDLGFGGLLRESEIARSQLQDQVELQEDQIAFFEGIRITYQAIIMFVDRLKTQAELQGSDRMAEALGEIIVGKPQTFYEALLMNYIYFILCEHIEGVQVRSLSNFDRLYYQYVQNDLAHGISEEQIRSDLAYFLLQFTAIGNYYNQPVFLGGCKEDESTVINELSYLFLDVYDKMGIYSPKVQIKTAESTPKDFILKALDMIRRGHNCIVFVNDATVRSALEKVGVSPDEARLCNIRGCYEYSPRDSMDCGMNFVNLLKPLEYVLHNGRDGITGELMGIKIPERVEYRSFDEFFAAYKEQLKYVSEKIMDVANGFEDYLSYINPLSMLSATYPSCLAQGRDALQGGSALNSSTMAYGFMADVVDSLSAIRKFVFEQRRLSLKEFTEILDSDFDGHELFRKELLVDKDKYGNNKKIPDDIAKDIVEYLCQLVCEKPTAKERRGKWNVSFHVARQSYEQAPLTASSANGRLKGEELSKNLSASMGMNREGATAAILSITKIDATTFTGNASLDLGLLPSAVKGEDGLEAMYALLKTFMKRKGHALQINVFDADTLRAAQRDPEKYKDLQIRVCGWNVLFNNISKPQQDGFIKQAEGLTC